MADYFSGSVEFGLNLSKRVYYGRGSAPLSVPSMSRSPEGFLPTAPMCYAVISDPEKVDNPDIRSYQPYVLGECDPPALIPLELHGVAMEVECSLDMAFVTVTGKWRVHCVTGSSTCDCQVAIPMGEQVRRHSTINSIPVNAYISIFSILSIFFKKILIEIICYKIRI